MRSRVLDFLRPLTMKFSTYLEVRTANLVREVITWFKEWVNAQLAIRLRCLKK